ncbi:Carboxypeptidase Q [Smittium mucronatum]|uniref:Carboxypeptidase Q n=1 Tax=Smittium mucronatum TaxID=133383 RepID=A0A1R0GWA9_9FUNG|nr:Carboxypeptidase Q [Smittium mucronatum]
MDNLKKLVLSVSVFLLFFLAYFVYSTISLVPKDDSMINLLLANYNNFEDTSIGDLMTIGLDLYGRGTSGQIEYDSSINWLMDKIEREKNLIGWTEDAKIDEWKEGPGYLLLSTPTRLDPTLNFTVKGIKPSVGTGSNGVEADVIPVRGLSELETLGESVISGNIVLFCQKYHHYESSNNITLIGAQFAEKYGAVAVLIEYNENHYPYFREPEIMYSSRIPTAKIDSKGSSLIMRMYNRYKQAQNDPKIIDAEKFVKPRAKLVMENKYIPDAKTSKNIIIDLKGSENPEEIVLISGAFSSSDKVYYGISNSSYVNEAFIGFGALKMIANLPSRPKRTVRLLMWNNEDYLGRGVREYVKSHKDELNKHVFSMAIGSELIDPKDLKIMGKDKIGSDFSAIWGGTFRKISKRGVLTRVKSPPNSGLSDLCYAGIPCGDFKGDYPYLYYIPSENGYNDPNSLRNSATVGAVLAYIMADQH